MRRFPAELADLLSPRGERLLSGRSPDAGVLRRSRFYAGTGLLDPRQARGCLALLERRLPPVLKAMEDPIPPEALWGMTENYAELLPKTVRVRTAMLESRRAKSFKVAEALGLVELLKSESFHALASVLAGRALRRGQGIQALCYGPGDYAGPHNDHHPEEPDARDGYVDVHLSFATAAVAHQWLVYERRGHLSEVVKVATVGGITAYRLPFWHYTTPLVARRGLERDARRWVLLGTFLDARKAAALRLIHPAGKRSEPRSRAPS